MVGRAKFLIYGVDESTSLQSPAPWPTKTLPLMLIVERLLEDISSCTWVMKHTNGSSALKPQVVRLAWLFCPPSSDAGWLALLRL